MNIQKQFVAGIYDCIPRKATCFDGRLFSAGNVFVLFRLSAAQSTSQCALHCLLLEQFLLDKITLQDYENEVCLRENTTLHWSREVLSCL